MSNTKNGPKSIKLEVARSVLIAEGYLHDIKDTADATGNIFEYWIDCIGTGRTIFLEISKCGNNDIINIGVCPLEEDHDARLLRVRRTRLPFHKQLDLYGATVQNLAGALAYSRLKTRASYRGTRGPSTLPSQRILGSLGANGAGPPKKENE